MPVHIHRCWQTGFCLPHVTLCYSEHKSPTSTLFLFHLTPCEHPQVIKDSWCGCFCGCVIAYLMDDQSFPTCSMVQWIPSGQARPSWGNHPKVGSSLTSSFSILRVASLDCNWWYRMSNSVCTGCCALTWHTCRKNHHHYGCPGPPLLSGAGHRPSLMSSYSQAHRLSKAE
jgi:hypothetical protein